MQSILEYRDVYKAYSGGRPVLCGVSFAVYPGRIVGLLGPNGCGKTTLIKLACGLLLPGGGQVLVEGEAPGIASRQKLSYLPDREALPGWMRTEDLLAFYADFFPDFDRVKANEMLAALGLPPRQRMSTMSKGTREKVQLILTMSRRARLFVLDEPIGGVDPAAREYILTTIIQNYSEDASVLLSTHLIADVERVLDEVVMVSGGQVALHQSVEALREEKGMGVDALFREVYRC